MTGAVLIPTPEEWAKAIAARDRIYNILEAQRLSHVEWMCVVGLLAQAPLVSMPDRHLLDLVTRTMEEVMT